MGTAIKDTAINDISDRVTSLTLYNNKFKSTQEKRIYMVKADFNIVEEYERLKRRNTELEAKNEELQTKAEYDGLTGLVRKEHAFDKFKELYISECRTVENTKKDQTIAYILSDVDDFTNKNSKYGRHKMDAPLKDLGEILLNNSREGDVVIRDGGEEDLILLKETDISGAYMFLEKIEDVLNNYDPLTYKRKSEIDKNILCSFKKGDKLTLSTGISIIHITQQNVQELKDIYARNRNPTQEEDNYLRSIFERAAKEADDASYLSKFKGKNQFNPFNPQTDYNRVRFLYGLYKKGEITPQEYTKQGGRLLAA